MAKRILITVVDQETGNLVATAYLDEINNFDAWLAAARLKNGGNPVYVYRS